MELCVTEKVEQILHEKLEELGNEIKEIKSEIDIKEDALKKS